LKTCGGGKTWQDIEIEWPVKLRFEIGGDNWGIGRGGEEEKGTFLSLRKRPFPVLSCGETMEGWRRTSTGGLLGLSRSYRE